MLGLSTTTTRRRWPGHTHEEVSPPLFKAVKARRHGLLLGFAIAATAVIGLLAGAGAPAQAGEVPPGFQETVVFTGLTQPTNVEFAPDGSVFVAEKSGIIKHFENLSDTTPTVFADLRSQVQNDADRGLLGLAVDPDFDDGRPYVYALYTYDGVIGGPPLSPPDSCGGGRQAPEEVPGGYGCVASGRLSRLEAAGGGFQETVLIHDWCVQFSSHSIGNLAFAPNGDLYVSGGEGGSFGDLVDYGQFANPCNDPPNQGGALRAQDLRTAGDPVTLAGTIIKLTPERLDDLAESGSTETGHAVRDTIVAYGMRNPFRFTVDPGTGDVWVGDVGWNEWEEINRIPANGPVRNFGWPCYEGSFIQPDYQLADLPICNGLYDQPAAHTPPTYQYRHCTDPLLPAGAQCTWASGSISGLAFYTANDYPAQYQGNLFFADYGQQTIWTIDATATGVSGQPTRFVQNAGTPVDLQTGPGGDLFYVDICFDSPSCGQVRRISALGANQPPQAVIDADPTSGDAPLLVEFDGSGSSDPDGVALDYAWDLDGDGQFDDFEVDPTREYPAGIYTVGLRVTDSDGAVDTDTVTITSGLGAGEALVDIRVNGAAVECDQVAGGMTCPWAWKVGDHVEYSGHALDDQEEPYPESAFSWSVIQRHCPGGDCHSHAPVHQDSGSATGSFIAVPHGYPSHLELILTVERPGDDLGVATTLLPQTADITVRSIPSGIEVGANATVGATPFSQTVIAGSSVQLNAPPARTLNGTDYTFHSWSNGGAAEHLAMVGPTDFTFTATYAQANTSIYAFRAIADAYLNASKPDDNQGRPFILATESLSPVFSYLKFDLGDLSGRIVSARLRVYAIDANGIGYKVHAVPSNGWGETAITFNNRPPFARPAASSSGPIGAPGWTDAEVTGLINRPGVFSLALTSDSRNWTNYASRETGPDAPRLLIETADSPPPAPVARCQGRPATIVGTPGADVIFGTPGRDVIVGLGGADIIYGMGGHDLICGNAGNDIVHGGDGNDTLVGGPGADTLIGEAGRDRLIGGPGRDVCNGGAGRDTAVTCEVRRRIP
ncbi:MAG: DNRLRE domain-containing protein [Dehalococcoidia bacterium]|nr:DNRLRE domain-containing protein [Dehalococcoidia bacterium]